MTKTKARISLKRDSASNWEANNPVLLDGEIAIVDTASGEIRIKIGDGGTTYNNLPFFNNAYSLPAATQSVLGGVKIGSGIEIQNDGVISVNRESIAASDEEVRAMLTDVFGTS